MLLPSTMLKVICGLTLRNFFNGTLHSFIVSVYFPVSDHCFLMTRVIVST